jgi:hypothetical protein
VRVLEFVIGVMFALGGLRSLWRWSRRHLQARAPMDHLLFALYVTGRVGLWFAFAALFIGYALIDQVDRFRWFILLPISLSAMQLIGGVFLGRLSAGATDDSVEG